MTWRLSAVPLGTKLAMEAGALTVNDVPFTDPGGWMKVPVHAELTPTVRDGELRARLVARRESDGREVLFIDRIRLRDTEYASLYEFALRHGVGWIRYVPAILLQCFETHQSIFTPSRASVRVRRTAEAELRPPARQRRA